MENWNVGGNLAVGNDVEGVFFLSLDTRGYVLGTPTFFNVSAGTDFTAAVAPNWFTMSSFGDWDWNMQYNWILGDPDNDFVYLMEADANAPAGHRIKRRYTDGDFTANLADSEFGASVTFADFNYDYQDDLAVGAPFFNNNMGAVFILFLQAGGAVSSWMKLGSNPGDFTFAAGLTHQYGWSLGKVRDVNVDGYYDLALTSEDDGVVVLFTPGCSNLPDQLGYVFASTPSATTLRDVNCVTGYEGSQTQVACTRGTWGAASGCTAGSCNSSVPTGPGFGSECDDLLYDGECTQYCAAGYGDNNAGYGQAYTCPSSGNFTGFTGTTLTCQANPCTSTSVANSNYAAPNSLAGVVGTTRSVQCNTGYTGGGLATCNFSAQFDISAVGCSV